MSLIGPVLYLIVDLNDNSKLFLTLLTAFSISGVINTNQTYNTEVYPLVVRATGFGINSFCGNIGGILFPIVIELLETKIMIMFTILNSFAILLTIFLPETNNKPLEDFIKID